MVTGRNGNDGDDVPDRGIDSAARMLDVDTVNRPYHRYLADVGSCGLDWQEEYAGASDVITMLYGDGRADRGHYVADKPLLAEPETMFSYSTGTSMMLAGIIADQVGAGDAGTAWAQAALFDPLGITSVTHDLDGVGTMSGGSTINMTAQDFARFGLLYLRGGMWDGRQLLPESSVDAARLPRADAGGGGGGRGGGGRRWGSGGRSTAPSGGSTTAPAVSGCRTGPMASPAR